MDVYECVYIGRYTSSLCLCLLMYSMIHGCYCINHHRKSSHFSGSDLTDQATRAAGWTPCHCPSTGSAMARFDSRIRAPVDLQRKMPVTDPTRRIILRLVMLSGGKTGVKNALCRSLYGIGQNRVERACKW